MLMPAKLIKKSKTDQVQYFQDDKKCNLKFSRIKMA